MFVKAGNRILSLLYLSAVYFVLNLVLNIYKTISIQKKRYLDTIFHFHRQLKTSQISQRSLTKTEVSVIFNKGQGLRSQTEVKFKVSFLLKYLKVKWKLVNPTERHMLISNSKYIILVEHLSTRLNHLLTGDRVINCVQVLQTLIQCIPKSSNIWHFFQTFRNL